MKRIVTGICAASLPLFLAGCSRAESSGASTSIIYGAAAALSLFLLIGYCLMGQKKRDKWFLLLFASVLVVNIGYFALSVSHSLEGALMANRISYLGSVFLPLSMLMIILNVTGLRYPKRLPALLLALAAVVFLIAASPGILDIYYKEVTFVTVDGVSSLQKVYGPLHFIYAVYLICYFSVMVAAILHAAAAKKLESTGHAAILAITVLANLGVWFAEQLSSFNFEFLSISYIISECFLLGLHLMISETERNRLQPAQPSSMPTTAAAVPDAPSPALEPPQPAVDQAQVDLFAAGLATLTPKEQSILECYARGMTTVQIMEELAIKENTLKFHNKNLYSKLSVSSRKQLLIVYNIYQTLRKSQ
jgi:DNA-binding CsgD family transcriptional regulator